MSQVVAKQCLWVMLVLILVYGIADAIGDVTSSGSTTNTQSNNAGSNISLWYS